MPDSLHSKLLGVLLPAHPMMLICHPSRNPVHLYEDFAQGAWYAFCGLVLACQLKLEEPDVQSRDLSWTQMEGKQKITHRLQATGNMGMSFWQWINQ